MGCDCITWAGKFGGLGIVKHHENCKRFDPNADYREFLERVVAGMDAWAADEDGIHPDCWKVYCAARLAIGKPVLEVE